MEKRLNYKLLQNSPDFENPKPELEQYSTPVDITLEIIKHANSLGHLSGKVVDLGCGTGRLAIGAAILGADVTNSILNRLLILFNVTSMWWSPCPDIIVCFNSGSTLYLNVGS